MAAARGVLQRNIPMLYTASRACLQHPDVAAYKANRDLIYKQLQHAVSGISNAAQATATEDSALGQPGGAGELACALNSFDVSIQVSMPISFLTVPPIEHIERSPTGILLCTPILRKRLCSKFFDLKIQLSFLKCSF